jgi:cytochrome c biogenesis protein CcmG/thiol:disulfide interchange protein DsbE
MKPQLLAMIPLLLFIALVALTAAPLLRGVDPARHESALIGRAMPDFSVPSLLDPSQRLTGKDIRGKPIVINFFASWCVPCVAEHPQLMSFAGRDDMALYGISYKDSPAAARDWLKKHGNPYRGVGSDDSGRMAIDWGVYGVPETYVIDADGIIRLRHVGPLTAADVEKTLLPLLEELAR